MALLTIFACVYVMFFAQRTYEATMTYALLSPKLPTEAELQAKPELSAVNGDNPYLRSGDRALLAQVLITKLGAQETAQQLKSQGLGGEYTVGQSLSSGSGMLLQLSASGNSPGQAVDTAMELGRRLNATLHQVQIINGADDSYLYSALAIDGPGQGSEIFTSRLRTLIIVVVAGALLVFVSVSVARSVELARARRPVVEKPAKHVVRDDAKTATLSGSRSGRGTGSVRQAGSGEKVEEAGVGLDRESHMVTVPDRESPPPRR
ncbi:hypothetical protein [Arthrobacter sp. SO3]|uniref:hypothetical protein n=1 Tax=Arthrobacter sp. SO3 TaxID=1897057 RepID=UPI001CFFC368|nr:hypothetical protein [Arthrobacter sp. SO3]